MPEFTIRHSRLFRNSIMLSGALLSLCLFSSTLCLSQQLGKAIVAPITATDGRITQVERFLLRPGALTQRTYVDVGRIKSCDIQAATFTDLLTNDRIMGIRFAMETIFNLADPYLAILDTDEADALIASLKLMQGKLMNSVAQDYTEARFHGRGGIQVGCYSIGKKGRWYAYMIVGLGTNITNITLDVEDLNKLATLLEQAKAKL